MSELVAAAIDRVARSEPVRVATLACITGLLALVFLVLLVADYVEAAPIS